MQGRALGGPAQCGEAAAWPLLRILLVLLCLPGINGERVIYTYLNFANL